MILFHITLSNKGIQKVLIPRIPEISSLNENVTIERISFAPTIRQCIFGAGSSLYNGCDIYVYQVDISEEDKYLKTWDELYNDKLVWDAPLTQEYWYTKPVIPISIEKYRLDNIKNHKYPIIDSSYNEKVKRVVENVMGMQIPNSILEYGAVGVLSHYRNIPEIEEIKSQLIHQKKMYDENQVEIYKKVFGTEPIQYEEESDFVELDYIDGFDLIKII